MVNIESIIEFVNNYFTNPYLIPFIISMLPIAELRLAIPYGLLIQDLQLYKVIIVSIFGNFLITIPIFLLLKYVSNKIMKYKYIYHIMNWVLIELDVKVNI